MEICVVWILNIELRKKRLAVRGCWGTKSACHDLKTETRQLVSKKVDVF